MKDGEIGREQWMCYNSTLARILTWSLMTFTLVSDENTDKYCTSTILEGGYVPGWITVLSEQSSVAQCSFVMRYVVAFPRGLS